MTIKYRVHYYESEVGWGSDSWNRDFDTEEEARKNFQDCWDKFMGKNSTPSYYIRPTYIGAVEVNE